MVIYLLTFAISTILIAIAEKRKTKYFVLLSAVALLIPCLLAAFRAVNVGSDTSLYLKPMTQAAMQAENIGEYYRTHWYHSYKNLYIKDYDIAFSLLVYFVTKLTSSMAAVQFAVSALTLVPTYAALAKSRKSAPVWLGMLIFYLYFYNGTYNFMRQMIAMAFLLLAFQYLVEKKWGWVAVYSALSLLFHSSAVIGIALFFVYGCVQYADRWQFAHNRFRMSGKMILVCLVTAASFVAILNLDLVIKLMGLLGVSKFSNYLEGDEMHLLVTQIVLRLPVIFLFLINWKDLRKATPRAAFYLGMMLMDMVLSQLISVDVYSFRIGYYCSIYLLLAVPELYGAIPCRFRRTVTTVAMIAYYLFFWYYTYVMQLRHATYPYSFMF